MYRKTILTLILLFTVGLAPALAANIFISKNKESASQNTQVEKSKKSWWGSFYSKITGGESSMDKIGRGKKTNKNLYKFSRIDRSGLASLKARGRINMENLAEWKASGKKPGNAQEIFEYAAAHRAAAQSTMYKRREALISHLDRENQKVASRISSRSSGAYAPSNAKAASQRTSQNKTSSKSGASQTDTTKKRRIFIRPTKSADEAAKPTKVFTGYR